MVSFLRDVCLLSAVLLNGVVASSLPGFVATNEENMNGDYVFSTTPGGTPGKFPKAYKDYPRGVEYFDVYSPPITTLYSQVWWSPLAPTKLPDEIVKKYNNTGMAIVGWEVACFFFLHPAHHISFFIRFGFKDFQSSAMR